MKRVKNLAHSVKYNAHASHFLADYSTNGSNQMNYSKKCSTSAIVRIHQLRYLQFLVTIINKLLPGSKKVQYTAASIQALHT